MKEAIQRIRTELKKAQSRRSTSNMFDSAYCCGLEYALREIEETTNEETNLQEKEATELLTELILNPTDKETRRRFFKSEGAKGLIDFLMKYYFAPGSKLPGVLIQFNNESKKTIDDMYAECLKKLI